FSHYTVNSATFHTYTSAHRVYSVIVAFHCYFCALTWFPNNFLNSDKTILDFRNFDFQQFFQERRVGSTQDDNWSITTHLHSFNHCTYRFTLSKEIARDLFRFWQEQFITFFVEHHQFLSPDLIYFSIDNLTYALSIFLQDSILFKIANS